MRLEQDRSGQLKNWMYVASSVLLFLTWALSLAALTQKGGVDGRLAWVFSLCFLTVPMIIYQSLTPIWSRTARFSNPHAHLLVDGLLIIFWASAWISLASYVVSGKGAGKETTKSGCDNFSHGSAAKCKISTAGIFFSLLVMLCFCATAWFSSKVLFEYRRTGIAPNSVQKQNISYPQSYKEDDEAFDSRLDVSDDGRGTGYSFEAARVHGGQPQTQPYGGYETVPGGDAYNQGSERPTSFGGPLNRL